MDIVDFMQESVDKIGQNDSSVKVCIYNCYNKGSGGSDILGRNAAKTDIQNCYGSTTATIEKLNTSSNIIDILEETGLYRANAWKEKDGNIVLDWE